jgi:hypothetical protein
MYGPSPKELSGRNSRSLFALWVTLKMLDAYVYYGIDERGSCTVLVRREKLLLDCTHLFGSPHGHTNRDGACYRRLRDTRIRPNHRPQVRWLVQRKRPVLVPFTCNSSFPYLVIMYASLLRRVGVESGRLAVVPDWDLGPFLRN